jgi:hypothetical protein
MATAAVISLGFLLLMGYSLLAINPREDDEWQYAARLARAYWSTKLVAPRQLVRVTDNAAGHVVAERNLCAGRVANL